MKKQMRISKSWISKLKAFSEREYQSEVEGKSEKTTSTTKSKKLTIKGLNLLLDPFVAKAEKQNSIISILINTLQMITKKKILVQLVSIEFKY